MKKKRIFIKKNFDKKKQLTNRLQMPISQYSMMYRKYMMEEYPTADLMIKKIIQMPCCRQYYLKFPLEGLMRGVIKKLMMNSYQLGVYGFFLEQIESWRVNTDIFWNLYQVFPDIIHVNEPSSPQELKQLSMFLYFSSYSVKQFLNSDIDIYKRQMQKVFPEFEHLHLHWVNSQTTVNSAVNPRSLNGYFKRLDQVRSPVDFNTCVDKIIQISPCYDLSGRTEKGKTRQFGYMQNGTLQDYNYNNLNNNLGGVKIEMEQIDIIDDFKFDGEDI